MAHFHNNALISASGGVGDEPPGNRSIRFNSGDSANLSKTFGSAGNRKKWTWSAWIKIADFDASDPYNFFFGAGASDEFYICQRSSQKIHIRQVSSGSEVISLITDQGFRDITSWGHLVVAVDTAQATNTNRIKVYWNGSQITSFSTSSYPSQNLDTHVNNSVAHYIGKRPNGNIYLDAYLTDVYFIDNLALDPSSFGAFDSNGVWQRGTYSGSHGTNGFHILDFANKAEIGGDSSGNGNSFTANNISDAEGAGLDLLVDFPTNGSETDTGAGGEVVGNYPTLNQHNEHSGNNSFTNGGLEFTTSGSDGGLQESTIAMSSGKFYFEVVYSRSGQGQFAGIRKPGSRNYANSYIYTGTANKYTNGGSGAGYGATLAHGDVIGTAFDADNGTLTFYKNGVSQGQAFSGISGTYAFFVGSFGGAPTGIVNFGQRPFTHAAPSGFKSLNTANLATPTILDGRDHFEAKLWTGNSSDQRAITGYQFSPDFVWIKRRNQSYSHPIMDTVRGLNNGHAGVLYANANNSEDTGATGSIRSFNSDGFNLGTDGGINYSGSTYVGWAWDAGSSTVSNNDGGITTSLRVNASCGVSIAKYSFNNSNGNQTLGHGLGVIPDLVIRKDTNVGDPWSIYSKAVGFTSRGHFTNAAFSGTTTFGSASATNTVNRANNMNNGTYVDYSFAAIPGFSAFGTYVGNGGTTNGPFVYTGFRPAFLLIKSHTSVEHWVIYDTKRSPGNHADDTLKPNSTDAEDANYGSGEIDILSNGFKLRGNWGAINHSSAPTYIYAAFAENPLKVNGGLAR